MPIVHDAKTKTFFLHTPASTYALGVGPKGHLLHLHWGARLRSAKGAEVRALIPWGDRPFSPSADPSDRSYGWDTLPAEFPTAGRGDYRPPAVEATFADGSRAFDLVYAGHRLAAGKPKLPGLPAVYAERKGEAQTLEIDLVDKVSGLRATLLYTVFEKLDAVIRSVRLANGGKEEIVLRRVLSASVDLPGSGRDFLTLSGAWARERDVVRAPLRPGFQGVESRRGTSSHQQNPFVAVLDPAATEYTGEVRGFSLVYSGNFVAQAEVDQFQSTRVQLGINPFEFAWRLAPGAAFQAPEAVLVFSAAGLDGMSQTYHALYRTRLARGYWRDRERPVLVNNWEATYFDFNAKKLVQLAKDSKKAGIELLVLDDGWFGRRNDDTTSLGDWFVDRKKLPGGLDDLARRVNKEGLKFGLWFEPEMISPKSELHAAHPDWCLHAPRRSRSEGRNQLILDLSRKDVCDWIVAAVGGVLASAPIGYVKWDMNRHMTEAGSALLPAGKQGEIYHRYVLGLYSVLDRLTRKFPKVLFEGCSGGGGRFDPGVLPYFPQTWASDNSDAISRLRIQHGTSLVYPMSAVTAHVSAVPNHQHGRVTPLATRGYVAFAGNLGYELDLGALSAEEQKEVREQVAFYKRHRRLLQFGRYHRLVSPFEGSGDAAWITVSPDRREAVAAYVYLLTEANAPQPRLRLAGLDPRRDYKVTGGGLSAVFGGDFLMGAGLAVPRVKRDFQSTLWTLRAV